MPTITEMFAFISTDGPGDEGVPAVTVDGCVYPLLGADLERIDSLRPVARRVGEMSGRPVRLVKFTAMVEVEQVWPPRGDE